jgi:multiple sugar transport system permease protein
MTSQTSRRRTLPMTVLGIVILVFMLFPVYWMFNVSLQGGGMAASSTFFPFSPDFSGYVKAIEQQTGNLGTSIIVSLGTVLLTLVISTPAAYALAQFRLPGVGIFQFALLIAQMIPGIVIANSLYTVFNSLGLLNSIPGLILSRRRVSTAPGTCARSGRSWSRSAATRSSPRDSSASCSRGATSSSR